MIYAPQADNRVSGRRIFDEGDQRGGIITGAENAKKRAPGLVDGDGVERWRTNDAEQELQGRNGRWQADAQQISPTVNGSKEL
jgi:carbohydrate-binding DOMON domain-containing protein